MPAPNSNATTKEQAAATSGPPVADTAPVPTAAAAAVQDLAAGRVTGRVKWYHVLKGIGFIVIKDGSNPDVDVFVHQTAISNTRSGFRSLGKDEEVEFSVVPGAKGS